jgi:hypothetical protein
MEFGDEDEAAENPVKPDSEARSSGFRRPTKSAAANPDRTPNGRPPAPKFHPLAYRSVVAGWPDEFRELWGRRANELEETGLSWRDAETQAFVEVWPQFRRSTAEPQTEAQNDPVAEDQPEAQCDPVTQDQTAEELEPEAQTEAENSTGE